MNLGVERLLATSAADFVRKLSGKNVSLRDMCMGSSCHLVSVASRMSVWKDERAKLIATSQPCGRSRQEEVQSTRAGNMFQGA